MAVEHERPRLRALSIAKYVNLLRLRPRTNLKDTTGGRLLKDYSESLLHLSISTRIKQALILALSLEQLGEHELIISQLNNVAVFGADRRIDGLRFS